MHRQGLFQGKFYALVSGSDLLCILRYTHVPGDMAAGVWVIIEPHRRRTWNFQIALALWFTDLY